MISRLIIQETNNLINSTTKSEKYQQDKVMTIQLVVYWILFISKTKQKTKKLQTIAAYLSRQKALDTDSRAIQQIAFTGSSENKTIVYYILEKSKETTLEFYKGKTKVL